MGKLAPLILVLALIARSLFGNTEDSSEEIQERKQPFSLETTILAESPAENFNACLNISGEYNFNSGYKALGEIEIENGLPRKAILAVGHPKMYLGAKWENLSGETSLLEDANLFKLETGIRDIADFLNLSSFVAYTSIPNMKARWMHGKSISNQDVEIIEIVYDTPLQLYTFGADWIVKPKFKLKNSTITPWLSGKILINGPIAQNTEIMDSSYDDSSFAWAFNHFNVGLGADFSTKNFDFGLENYWDGNHTPLVSGTKHKIKAGLHNKESFLRYSFTLNPQFNWLGWLADWDLQSDLDFRLHFIPELYMKGNLNMNHSTTENPNLIAALGYLNKNGANIELFLNLQSKMIGVTFSNRNLGNKLERYSKEPFREISISDVDGYSLDPFTPDVITLEQRVETIHAIYGEDVSDVVNYIRSNSTDYNSAIQQVSKYASYFAWRSHAEVFSAEQEHDEGWGDCADTNGNLLPTVINGVLGSKGYKSWGKILFGPYVGHALTIIKKPNGKYDVMDYDKIYFLDAKTEQEAIDSVFPGAYAYDGGKYSETSKRVIKALEESVWR